jgi:hypothetical protein
MKKWLTCVLVMVTSLVALGQREIDGDSKPSFADRLYFGGGLGLNGGTDSYGYRYFYVGLYPIIGYMVNNQFSVGMGITYQYYSYPDVDQTIHQYGFSPFARYNFGQVFLYAEYSLLNTPTYYPTGSLQRKNFSRLLLGVGYSQPLGRRGSINAMGLYDVMWKRSDYAFASPWVLRVYFSY